MENRHFQWENPLFLWPFSIDMLVYKRVILQNRGLGECNFSAYDLVYLPRFFLVGNHMHIYIYIFVIGKTIN